MSELKVQHFGPVTSGFTANDGFIDFRKVTVFIGNQGTGKSSVAKLFSTLSWLEKVLFQGRLKPGYVTSYNRFVREFCAYQNLRHYFQGDDTIIEYRGKAFSFVFRNNKLEIQPVDSPVGYRVPQIMYVPAERNFLSAVDNPDKLKGLPLSLSTFWNELSRSQQELTKGLALPIGNARFEFDKSNKISWIASENQAGKPYRLRLSEASSGFQSFVPLLLVSSNLSASIHKERDASRSELSGEERKRVRDEIERILSNEKLSAEVKQQALELLSARFKNEQFLNIVEEPEQNLFPQSQQTILFKLLEFANKTPENELVLTTHSPYIINHLTLAIKAQAVSQKITDSTHQPEQQAALRERLAQVVPATATVAAADVAVYELSQAGEIAPLATYRGLPSDDNYLNRHLEETNNLFADLLDLEAAAS